MTYLLFYLGWKACEKSKSPIQLEEDFFDLIQYSFSSLLLLSFCFFYLLLVSFVAGCIYLYLLIYIYMLPPSDIHSYRFILSTTKTTSFSPSFPQSSALKHY
ncbi:hypothetical protein ACH5RR_027629 [Cinchona calisaya]|uniref:Uncharacterized protein n=1 Tax=Cinchona calisaya TaxID=153742 RepID=A0ABD2Z998_9GENT